jgi:pilus assembly protein FimV
MMAGSTTKRLLTRMSIVGASLYPILSFALGLSDIEVDSRLNQPLRARIEIIDVSDDDWRQIRARLPREVSEDNVVVHPELLDLIKVRAVEDINHRHFIELRSAEVLTEPVFDLPVEVAGPAMRVIRNYSVLLDPPAPHADEPRGVDEPRRPEALKRPATLQRFEALQSSNASQTSSRPSPVGQQTSPAEAGGLAKPASAQRILTARQRL